VLNASGCGRRLNTGPPAPVEKWTTEINELPALGRSYRFAAKMGTWGFSDLLHTLDPRPEVRFREFERICRWYLLNAPEYTSRIRNVWLWSDWLDAWGRDAGIDLIAEERDGGLWAIQAKLYDPAYAIKKADVDSFLSESARYDFAYRLLIATTDRLGPTARKTLDSQRQPVGYLLRSQLELAQVAWPASAADMRPHRPARKQPLPHVREAIDETVNGFADQERGQLIMACGTGKTLAGLWIAERLGSSRTLVLVPSLSLLAQTLREWSANASGAFEYLAVCSDETVVGEDELVRHTSELGLPVTTSPEAIAAFLRRRGRRVVFATYQSSPQIAAAYRSRTPAFDLAIADESHRCAGRVSSEFATILDAQRIRARRRLFMTATPRYYTTRLRDEAGLRDVEVASMDDEAAFGPVLHRLTFGDAIARDLLSDYQVVVVGVDDETYRAWAERGELVTRDGTKLTDARTLAGQVGLVKAVRKYRLRRVISFHSRVKAARNFSGEVPDVIAWMPTRARPAGELWSEHVSGAMTSGQRDRLLLRFRNLGTGEWGLLSNARCLGEGVDVPAIDGIAFIDPRRSTIDIIQALGRAIRKAPDKRVGTVVLPVFIADDDPEQALDDSSFRCVWDVLKALRAHDEALGEELDELRRDVGRLASPPRRPGKIKLDLPAARVGAAFAEAFNIRLVEQTTATWDYWFGLLLVYVSRTGDSCVPTHYVEPNGYKLGYWVAAQRRSHTRGELSDARAKQLEDLPRWTWHTHRDAWEDGYERMRRFVAREGHADVPKGFVDQDGSRLDLWALHQRADYRSGKLTTERARRLEQLDGWKWEPDEAAFNHGLEQLRR
jgi:predicted helicase